MVSSAFLAFGQDPAVWVAGAFPGPLVRALEGRGGLPRAVREEIARQLAEDVGPSVLRERIERRWYERFAHVPPGELADRADEVAMQLVAASECPLGCEDGWLLAESRVCAWCRPNGTVVDVRPEDLEGGRRLSSDEHVARAEEVRALMRHSRRYPKPR
ncbi:MULTISPECIES: hypothetical protein [Kitasatospora]|uniref:Uncharacterized protein n=2 Tax=Kitasatospora TaxID=2063 RepID=A0ABT1J2Y4_9ACTN|nr:hypothetical protein [Kitasatospora paracochleata]MCP2311096.1 hypothetical protein [Kitasatospora paracochleata]